MSQTHPKLTCRLQHKAHGRATGPTAGEIELENTSSEVLEIDLQMSPLQHLNLIVADGEGRTVSEGHYGDRFSPVEVPYTLRLQPGEKYTATVALLGTVPPSKQVPGTYLVRAVYEYQSLRAVSNPVHVRIPDGVG